MAEVSDSEPEYDVLPLSTISRQKLQHNINTIPEAQKSQVLSRLNASIYHSLIAPDPISHLPSITNTHHDEQHDLDVAILSIQSTSTLRRGLRKRNFASTHPYLADQAHWLDLASIDYLNEIYQQNQDLEGMLKFLNQQYIRKKRRYPQEERYKSKSFFTFLGKSNPNAHNGASAQDDPDVPDPEPSQIDIDNAYDSDSIGVQKHRGVIEDSDHSSDESLIDIDQLRTLGASVSETPVSPVIGTSTVPTPEDAVVRVGGRVRKQRNILRGVLPESAKRLDIWKGKKPLHSEPHKVHDENRKGVAKRKLHSHRSFRNEASLYDDLVDDNESDESIDYLTLNNQGVGEEVHQVQDAGRAFEERYRDYISPSSSDTDDEPLGPLESLGPAESLEAMEPLDAIYGLSELGIPGFGNHGLDDAYERVDLRLVLSGYVRDEPEINPDFTRSSTIRPNNSTRSGATKSKGSTRIRPGSSSNAKLRTVRHIGTRRYRTLSGRTRRLGTKTLQWSLKKRTNNQRTSSGISRQPTIQDDTSIATSVLLSVDGKSSKQQTETPNPPISDIDPNPIEVPQVLMQGQAPITEYFYRRDPHSFTWALEAESSRKYIKHPRFQRISERAITSSSLDKSDFVNYDVSVFHSLSQGFLPMSINSPIVVFFNSKRYVFDLITQTESRVHAQLLLIQVARVLNTPNFEIGEIMKALEALLSWYLLSQEEPDLSDWKYTRSLLKRIVRQRNLADDKLFCLLLSIYFARMKTAERFKPVDDEISTDFYYFSGLLWWKVFESVDEDVEYGFQIKASKLFSFMWQMLSFDTKVFWRTVQNAVDNGLMDKRSLCLSGLFFIGNQLESKYYSWDPFYALYDRVSNEDQTSVFQKDFLDVCFLLNQRKNWPLQEKLIMKLYSSITNRRFFNYEDEMLSITLLPKIHTLNELPDTTYFEAFIRFLFFYTSTLTKISSSKRLITKLITSSHYHYEKGRKYQTAFVNRFNFIILLAQLSTINQNALVNDLVRLIVQSKDVDIYLLAIQELKTYTQIAIEKNGPPPCESFSMLLKAVSEDYMQVPGVSRVFIQLFLCLKEVFSLNSAGPELSTKIYLDFLNIVNQLSLQEVSRDIASKLLEMTIIAVEKLSYSSTSLQNNDVATALNNQIREYLSSEMGGFPMKTRIREEKALKIVENSIKLWVSLSAMITPNWNKILFQDFPYMGNSYLRNLFRCRLICEILAFHDLDQHRDMIYETILQQLARLSPSRYTCDVINALRRFNLSILDFKKVHLNRRLTHTELNTYRNPIVTSMLLNIIKGDLLESTKVNLLRKFIESMNDEYDKYFKSSRFVDFCKKNIQFLQVQSIEFFVDNPSYKELVNKLDITPVSENQMKWKKLPKLQKVSFLHQELVSSIIYDRDPSVALTKYNDESFDTLFSLISVYLKGVIGREIEFWLLISISLDHLWKNLEAFKVDVATREFARFVISLGDMTSVCFLHWGSRFANVLRNYQLKCLCLTYDILHKAYYLFEGFMDHKFIREVIKKLLLDYSFPSSRIAELTSPYSSFEVQDISKNNRDLLKSKEDYLLKPDRERFDPEEHISALKLLINNEYQSGTLDFELAF